MHELRPSAGRPPFHSPGGTSGTRTDDLRAEYPCHDLRVARPTGPSGRAPDYGHRLRASNPAHSRGRATAGALDSVKYHLAKNPDCFDGGTHVSPEGFRLIPAPRPKRRGPRTNLYIEIIQTFLASPESSVIVDLPGKTPLTIAKGLRRATSSLAVDVRVAVRSESVHLYR